MLKSSLKGRAKLASKVWFKRTLTTLALCGGNTDPPASKVTYRQNENTRLVLHTQQLHGGGTRLDGRPNQQGRRDPILIVRKRGRGVRTPHLQGYIYFEHQTALPKCKRLLPRAHLEPQRGTISQAINYCHKDKDFYEFGNRPETPEEKGKRGREGIEQRWKLAKEGRFEELPPEHFKIYKAIYLEYKPKPKKLEGELLNEWIWGPPGSGKSTLAEKENPIFYEKC